MSTDITILKVGGSIIAPDGINHDYVRALADGIAGYVAAGKRLILIIGGGGIARTYQKAAVQYGASEEDKDWIGIRATHLNAELVRVALGEYAHPHIVTSLDDTMEWQRPVLVAGGSAPGRSTDTIAAELAQRHNTRNVVIATNVDHVYPEDPRTNPDAAPYERLTWSEYIGVIPDQWKPGLSAPVDPVAARFAQQHDLTFRVLDGNNVTNIENAIAEQAFVGTIITGK